MPTLGTFAVVQLAYVVTDLVASCRQLHEVYGIGPFFRSGAHPLADVSYRGRPADEPVVIDIALAWSGELNIELIQQHSAGPSSYREVYPDGTGGFHHVAAWAADYDAEVAALAAVDCPVSMEMRPWDGCRICYVDTRPLLGHMTELYTDDPRLRAVHAHVRSAAEQWDGTDLIRPLDFTAILSAAAGPDQ